MRTSHWLLALLLTLGLSGCPSSNDDDSSGDDDDATGDDDDATGDDDDATGDDDDATGDDDSAGDDDDSAGDDDDSAGDDDDSAPGPASARFALLDSGEYGPLSGSSRFRAIADLGDEGEYRFLQWDDAAGVFWGLKNSTSANFAPQLFTVDPCTGAVTDGLMLQVTSAGSLQMIGALAVDANGTVWVAWSPDGNGLAHSLATLDTSTGAITLVGAITGTPQGELDELFWHEGSLYGAASDGSPYTTSVYAIDTTTAVASAPVAQPYLRGWASDVSTGALLAFNSDHEISGASAFRYEFLELDDSFGVSAGLGLGWRAGAFGDADLQAIGIAPVVCADDDDLLLDMEFDGEAADTSGYGYPLWAGSGSATSDRHGNASGAWELNGIAAVVGPIWNPGASGALSVAGWFRPNVDLNGASGRHVITSHDYSTHQVYYQGGSLMVELYDENHSPTIYVAANDFPQDAWVHFAVTATAGGPVTIYVNNVATSPGTAPTEFDEAVGELAVGAQLAGNNPFMGAFDDLTVHDRELTAAEVSALFTATP